MAMERLVSGVEILDKAADPSSAEAAVRVVLKKGAESTFVAATFDRPQAWLREEGEGHWFSDPVLFVSRLAPADILEAAEAMAADLGGYWLRYYRSGPPGPPCSAPPASVLVEGVRGGCCVVEAVLRDGREFSMLAATPAWWRQEAERRRLRFYFGAPVLFLKALDAAHARKAAKAMSARDAQLFCRYDTPRKTLPEILDEFSARHP